MFLPPTEAAASLHGTQLLLQLIRTSPVAKSDRRLPCVATWMGGHSSHRKQEADPLGHSGPPHAHRSSGSMGHRPLTHHWEWEYLLLHGYAGWDEQLQQASKMSFAHYICIAVTSISHLSQQQQPEQQHGRQPESEGPGLSYGYGPGSGGDGGGV